MKRSAVTRSRLTCKCGKSFSLRHWEKHKLECGLARNEMIHHAESPIWNAENPVIAMDEAERAIREKLASWNAGRPVKA